VWSDGAHITRQRLRDILRKEPNPLHRGKTQLASSSQSALAGDAGIAGPHMRNLAVSANPVSDRCRFHRCAAKRPVGGWVATHASKSSLRTRPHVTAASRISVTVCGLVRTKNPLVARGTGQRRHEDCWARAQSGILESNDPAKMECLAPPAGSNLLLQAGSPPTCARNPYPKLLGAEDRRRRHYRDS
jgi:hypothetical protein